MAGVAAGAAAFLPVPWVTNLIAHYKVVGNGGTRSCKLAVRRSDASFTGQSWALLERGLVQWHRGMRLAEIYPAPDAYFPQEMIPDGTPELDSECADRSTTADDPLWLNNRTALNDFLVADHLQDLVAERNFLAPALAPPSSSSTSTDLGSCCGQPR